MIRIQYIGFFAVSNWFKGKLGEYCRKNCGYVFEICIFLYYLLPSYPHKTLKKAS